MAYTDFDVVLKAGNEGLENPVPNYYRITVERGDGEVCSLYEAATALRAASDKLADQARNENILA